MTTTGAMPDAPLSNCRDFADKVARGEATLKNATVDIKPPNPVAGIRWAGAGPTTGMERHGGQAPCGIRRTGG